MSPEDIARIIERNPTLLTIFGIILIIGYAMKIVSQASETASKYLGPLGRRWREQGNRSSRRAEARRSEENQVIQDLMARVEYFVEQVEELKEHGRQKEAEYEVKDAYLAYDAAWHGNTKIHAAEVGYQFPPPEHMTFNEFRRKASGWEA